jgi:hypothetical protein
LYEGNIGNDAGDDADYGRRSGAPTLERAADGLASALRCELADDIPRSVLVAADPALPAEVVAADMRLRLRHAESPTGVRELLATASSRDGKERTAFKEHSGLIADAIVRVASNQRANPIVIGIPGAVGDESVEVLSVGIARIDEAADASRLHRMVLELARAAGVDVPHDFVCLGGEAGIDVQSPSSHAPLMFSGTRRASAVGRCNHGVHADGASRSNVSA